jgi:hypothetical protein
MTAQGHKKNTLKLTITILMTMLMTVTAEQVCPSGYHSSDAQFQSQLRY